MVMSQSVIIPSWYSSALNAKAHLIRGLRQTPLNPKREAFNDEQVAGLAQANTGLLIPERMVPGGNTHPSMVEHVQRYVWAMQQLQGLTVVDAGCGAGYGSFLLSWVCPQVTGIDIEQQAIDDAQERYQNQWLTYCRQDLSDIHIPLPSADAAMCFEVLEHIPHPEIFLERLASTYSRVLLSFPNPLWHGSQNNPHHINDWPCHVWKRTLQSLHPTKIHFAHQSAAWRSTKISKGAYGWQGIWLADLTF